MSQNQTTKDTTMTEADTRKRGTVYTDGLNAADFVVVSGLNAV